MENNIESLYIVYHEYLYIGHHEGPNSGPPLEKKKNFFFLPKCPAEVRVRSPWRPKKILLLQMKLDLGHARKHS